MGRYWGAQIRVGDRLVERSGTEFFDVGLVAIPFPTIVRGRWNLARSDMLQETNLSA